MQTHSHQLPNAAALKSMNVDELMTVTLRLSDILAEESTLLDTMKIGEMPKLHDEKMKLTGTLETYQHAMAANPEFLNQADAATREELLLRTDDLAFNIEENFRKVSAARAVNARVMQAIMDVVNEQHRPNTYDRHGQASNMGDLTLSMNLNQRA